MQGLMTLSGHDRRMWHGDDDGIRRRGVALQDQAVFLYNRRRIGNRIMNLHGHAERLKLSHDIDGAGIADVGNVFLERQSQQSHSVHLRAGSQETAQALARGTDW